MALSIEPCTIADLESAPNIHAILAEYADESSIEGMPTPAAKVEMYKLLESTGALRAIGAFLNGELVGYVTILASVLPHYSSLVAVTESFFVAKEQRKTGAGLKLLRKAEEYAVQVGSPGLLISAPFGGALAEVLPHVGYVETNRVFFKRFGDVH